MKSFVASILLAVTLSSSVAGAQVTFPPVTPVPGEVSVGAAVSPMRKGQVAPFTGVLLSPEAVAKIIVDYNNAKEQTEIEAKKARETQKAQDQLIIDNLKADIDREKAIAEAQVKSRDGQLKILSDALEKAEKDKPNPTLWAGIGVVAGAAITIITVFVVGSVK
jgi:hypothetical protein